MAKNFPGPQPFDLQAYGLGYELGARGFSFLYVIFSLSWVDASWRAGWTEGKKDLANNPNLASRLRDRQPAQKETEIAESAGATQHSSFLLELQHTNRLDDVHQTSARSPQRPQDPELRRRCGRTQSESCAGGDDHLRPAPARRTRHPPHRLRPRQLDFCSSHPPAPPS